MGSAEAFSHLRDSSRYTNRTCVGNWAEEREMQRSMLKSLLAGKGTGTLKLDGYQNKMGAALQEVELTRVADDPYVHFGDVLQLVHLESGAVLACDVSDRDSRPGEEACAATAATETTKPCARNALVLVRYHPPKTAALEPEYGDDILRYGQKVHVAAHPWASGCEPDSEGGPRKLLLFSKPPSSSHASRYSRQQLVGFTYRADSFDTVWQVVTPDPAQRIISEGVEVLAGAPVLLLHVGTQKPLLAGKQRYPNDFGNELELTAKSSTSTGLKLAMEQESKGIMKGSLPKPEAPENFWSFNVGTAVARLPAPRPASEKPSTAFLSNVVSDLLGRGNDALGMLERKLVLHENKAMELPADELLLLLRQAGSSLPESDVAGLAACYRTQKPGIIDCGELLRDLRAVWARAMA